MQDYYHNELGQLRALIVNLHHDNVSITGQGTIDFSGHAFYALGEYNVPESKVPFTPEQVLECTHPIGERPAHCLFMHGSKNLTVRGITLLDSPCWTPTFSECENVKITGVTCIGENAIGIAAIIALADILPVIGSGGVLIPWAIIALFTQNYFLALGLLLLYVVILVVRNFAEPKIVGDQLGLNPLVTLIAIYLGYLSMGVLGMIALPVITNILVGLQRTGKIKLWKE